MQAPVCDGSLSFPANVPTCTGNGWVVKEWRDPLALTLPEAEQLSAAVIGVLCFAWVFRVAIRQLVNR